MVTFVRSFFIPKYLKIDKKQRRPALKELGACCEPFA
jgi:hypothetical protein